MGWARRCGPWLSSGGLPATARAASFPASAGAGVRASLASWLRRERRRRPPRIAPIHLGLPPCARTSRRHNGSRYCCCDSWAHGDCAWTTADGRGRCYSTRHRAGHGASAEAAVGNREVGGWASRAAASVRGRAASARRRAAVPRCFLPGCIDTTRRPPCSVARAEPSCGKGAPVAPQTSASSPEHPRARAGPRANGPSETSLGQRPRKPRTMDQRAESPPVWFPGALPQAGMTAGLWPSPRGGAPCRGGPSRRREKDCRARPRLRSGSVGKAGGGSSCRAAWPDARARQTSNLHRAHRSRRLDARPHRGPAEKLALHLRTAARQPLPRRSRTHGARHLLTTLPQARAVGRTHTIFHK